MAVALHERPQPLRAAGVALVVAAGVFVLGVRDGSFDTVAWQQAAVVTWLALGLGCALKLWDAVRLPRALLLALAGGVGLLAWSALSLAWSPSADRTLDEVARIAFYLGVLGLAAFAVGERDREAAGAGLALGVVAICALALASRLAPNLFDASSRARVSLVSDRLSYPVGYWNGMAAWAGVGLAMTLAWSAEARAPLARGVALAAAPVCATTLYLTYSRAGVGDAVLAVLLALVLCSRRETLVPHLVAAGAVTALAIGTVRDHHELVRATGDAGGATVIAILALGGLLCLAVGAASARVREGAGSRRAGRAVLVGTAVLLLVAVGVAAARDVPQKAWDDFNEPVASAPVRADDPASRLGSFQGGRKLVWDSALDAFGAHEVEGVGAGTFELWWNRGGGEEFLHDGHSLYLEVLAELGLPGLVLLLVLLGGLVVAGLQGRRSMRARPAMLAALGVFLFHAAIDWLWEIAALACVALAAGVLAAGGEGRRPLGRALRIGVPVLAVLAVLLQASPLASTSLVRRSQDAATAGDRVQALGLAEDAIRAEPWAGAPYGQRALVEESAGRLGRAARSARLAIDREPDDWRYPLILARIEAERGRAGPALAAIREARRLRPASAFLPGD